MIFFDLDGTLLNDDEAKRHAVATLHQAFRGELTEDLEAFAARWRAVLEVWFDRYLAKEITMQEQRRGRIREFFPGVADAEADRRFAVYAGVYDAHFHVYPDTVPALDALAPAPLGVITNGHTVQQRNKLAQTGLLARFAHVVVSEEAGAAKPKPEIFREAARRAGVAAAVCTYVGDRLETDALAATAAGWRGIWLNRDVAKPADPRVPTIRSLAEVAGL